jgi:outer membrane protein assembly factor BamB
MLLTALNIHNGKQLWQREHDFDHITLLSGQELYGYQGYGGNGQGKKALCALNSTDGKDRWCQNTLQPGLFSLSTSFRPNNSASFFPSSRYSRLRKQTGYKKGGKHAYSP